MRGKNVGDNIRELHRGKIRQALEEKRKISRHIKNATKKGLESGLSCGEKCLNGVRNLSKKWFTHVFLLTVLFGYAALGAAVFSILEGTGEDEDFGPGKLLNVTQLCDQMVVDIRNVSTRGDFSRSTTDKIVKEFEDDLRNAIKREAYVPKQTKWAFWSSMFFCGTVFTTIGYGHITPVTTTGRIATIIYASIGIPLTLMVLVDIGKLFTKVIKFIFKSVMRFCHTGSCTRMRKAMPVEAVTKVFHNATEKAMSQIKDRSPSSDKLSTMDETERKRKKSREKDAKHDKLSPTASEDWGTPAPSPSVPPRSRKMALGPKDSTKSTDSGDENWFGTSSTGTSIAESVPIATSDSVVSIAHNAENIKEEEAAEEPTVYEVDDEFNLPVSIALLLLVGYIMLGAFLFTFWEDWDLFEAFYFIFISISTIGFGDYIPKHPMFMMTSFLYLLFGLALTSMCINVGQEALALKLNSAKIKLSARMGLELADVDEVDEENVNKPKCEVAEVHKLQVFPTPPPRQKRKRSAVPGSDDYELGSEV